MVGVPAGERDAAPDVKDAGWAKTKIDGFVLAKLEQKNLKPSPQADPSTLVTRAYIDLVGFSPDL